LVGQRSFKHWVGIALLALGALGATHEPNKATPPATAASCWPGAPGTNPDLCPPNDPEYKDRWELKSDIPRVIDRRRMHPAEAALGAIGMSVDTAWQLEQGRDDVVIAVLDSGIRWRERDLTEQIYLNKGELPLPAGSSTYDANGDGALRVSDYANDPRVGDKNGNGFLDPGDLILAFSDCKDDDGNGYPDDIAGYDFMGSGHCGNEVADNDPTDDTDFGHGTGIAVVAAGGANNGIGDAGICAHCRVLPVRVGDSFVVDANRFARGLEFAVHAGVTIVAAAAGSYNDTPAAHRAVDLAYERGVAIVGSAADEYSYHHNFPSALNHVLYVNAVRYNDVNDWRAASTFWGVNPCTNFGARVWVSVPAVSCSSGATARLAGVVGLIESAALDAGHPRLAPEDVYQILRASADDLDNTKPDWGALRWIARPGFDQNYGYGRVHARRAVEMARDGAIPPRADLLDPDWFAIVPPARGPLPIHGSVDLSRGKHAHFRLEYALGVEPAERDYTLVAEGEVDGSRTGLLGKLDFAKLPVPKGPPPRNREERDRYSVTLRLSAKDDSGQVGEARRSFFVLDDPAWVRGFPVDLDGSGEAGPTVVDLDGDGRAEIVLPTAGGLVRVFGLDDTGTVREIMSLPLDESPAACPGGITARETVIRAAAVGDIDGDGKPEIVVASREGKVYTFDRKGARVRGFPVSIDPERARPTPELPLEVGILSNPVLANLDGRPGLEVLVSALDGRVYAWGKNGARLPGFPVGLDDGSGDTASAKIVSSPAVGDLDGDGRPEIIVGSNGLVDGAARAYSLRVRGRSDAAGAFRPGWAALTLPAVRPGLLPTVATGVQMDPLLVDADGDGDLEVVLYAVTGSSIVLVDDEGSGGPQVLARYSLEPAERSTFRDTYFLGGTGSPGVADLDGDGRPEIFAPLLPLRMLTLRAKPGVPLEVPLALGGWPASPARGTDAQALLHDPRGSSPETVPMLPSWPRRMEDLMLFTRPRAADLDGDGKDEVLMGSGGYLLHAFRADGGEAAEFPKFTGGWTFSAAAVGDLDGDGKPEVVSVTREGNLFAWRSRSPASPVAERRSRE
jgi:hypothetical protein